MKTADNIMAQGPAGQPGNRRDLSRRLNPGQQRLIDYLSNGGHHSVIDIAVALRIGDPRSAIRDLRRAGLIVSDEWVNTKSGSSYKRFWIRKEDCL